MARRMFGPRTRARSQALQLLFQAEACERAVVDVLEGPFVVCEDDEGEETPAELAEFASALALGADDLRPELDAIIASVSKNWAVSRMPAVDRNLLRLAVFEMIMVDDVAVAVTIDESVELAKAYGTDESSRFINGVLGRVADRIEEGHDLIAEATAELERKEREEAEAKAAEAAAAAEAARAAEEAEDASQGAEPVETETEAAEATDSADDTVAVDAADTAVADAADTAQADAAIASADEGVVAAESDAVFVADEAAPEATDTASEES